MSRKSVGIALIVIGVVLAAISVFADVIGLGSGSFGLKQQIGTGLGVIALVAGIIVVLLEKRAA